MNLHAGIDMGTSSVKVVLLSEDGRLVSNGRSITEWTETSSRTEAHALSLLRSVLTALADALERLERPRVAAIGVASIAESGILVDGFDAPLAPVIAWHDTRDDRELRALASEIGADRFAGHTGLPFRQQWSLTKHRWLLSHLDATRNAVRRYNVAEWIVRCLGGAAVTERSLASRTGWLELATGEPWNEALEWSGATSVGLSDLVDAGEPLGNVSDHHGLQAIHGATLTVAGHDHQAAAVGANALGETDELNSCGTAEVLVRTVAPQLSVNNVVQLTHEGLSTGWHAVSGRWAILGGTKNGLMLGEVLALLGRTAADIPELDRLAAEAKPDLTTVSWNNGSNGLEVAGSTDPGCIWLAATSTAAASLNQLGQSLSRHVGSPTRVVATGGWSRSDTLMAAKANYVESLHRSDVAEPGARGAALLAGLAHGTYRSIEEATSL